MFLDNLVAPRWLAAMAQQWAFMRIGGYVDDRGQDPPHELELGRGYRNCSERGCGDPAEFACLGLWRRPLYSPAEQGP